MQIINGILPVNKPSGMSSFDVIRVLKQRLKFDWKSVKIGHGGTLDLLAAGVLLILFGEATKAFDFLLKSRKEYIALISLGANTDTDDAEGSVIETFEKDVALADIEQVLPGFIGKINQVPPRYSALRVNGRRGYELARNNIAVEMEPRLVEIYDIRLDRYEEKKKELSIIVSCSSGTYIRSLARDIGKKLGCGGYIKKLVRSSSSGITLEKCMDLDDVTDLNIRQCIISLNDALPLEQLTFLNQKEFVLNGRILKDDFFKEKEIRDGLYKIIKDNIVLAVVEKKGVNFNYLRVFNE